MISSSQRHRVETNPNTTHRCSWWVRGVLTVDLGLNVLKPDLDVNKMIKKINKNCSFVQILLTWEKLVCQIWFLLNLLTRHSNHSGYWSNWFELQVKKQFSKLGLLGCWFWSGWGTSCLSILQLVVRQQSDTEENSEPPEETEREANEELLETWGWGAAAQVLLCSPLDTEPLKTSRRMCLWAGPGPLTEQLHFVVGGLWWMDWPGPAETSPAAGRCCFLVCPRCLLY